MQVVSEEPGPEFGGFNTKRAREEGQRPKSKMALVYTPFLDMIPSEPDTIKKKLPCSKHSVSLNWRARSQQL